MKQIQLIFHHDDTVIRATLLETLAPVTCEAFWEVLAHPLSLTARHAMYTGRELSMPMPADRFQGTRLRDAPPENLTCFPAPGDLLYTYLPPHAWSGVASPIFDLGCFYGRDARTFFPAGWLPGNRFAEVVAADVPTLASLGARALSHGEQTLTLKRA